MMSSNETPTWEEIEERTDTDALIIKECIEALTFSQKSSFFSESEIYNRIIDAIN